MELCVGGKYYIKKKIGSGSFGDIYLGEDCNTKEPVAMKLESVYQRPSQLANEKKLYKVLSGGSGIPKMLWYGMEGDYNILVLEYLGKSLEDCFVECRRQFSLKCVLMIAVQLITLVEYIHKKGFLHRDIKPENFILGVDRKENIIHMIDYGISSRYIDPKTQAHIECREGKNVSGTARYASINNHLGIEPSRRDDLESVAYILIYFLNGSLPWQSLTVSTKRGRYDAIMKKKMEVSSEELCLGLPSEFKFFLDEVRKLDFAECPNYSLYKEVFMQLFIREGFAYDYDYDWMHDHKLNIHKSFSNSFIMKNKASSQMKNSAYSIILDGSKRSVKKKAKRPLTCKPSLF